MSSNSGTEKGLPFYYPFKLGEAVITVVSDGPLDLGDPRENFMGVEPKQVSEMLHRNFLPEDNVVLDQNIPVVDINGKRVIFDTGMGTSKMFGETTGRLMKSLSEAGIVPESIDAVVLSHAHIDHVGGVCDDDGNPNFPNAQVYISQRDFEDWTDGSTLDASFAAQVENARKNLLPVRDRLVFFKDGEEFLSGVTAVHAPGHTLGHHCFVVHSGGDSFCFMGDLTHHHVLLMERPWMEFKYDTDPKLSVKSRTRVLDMMATDRIKAMSYHFAWPGLGNVARDGEGFRYYPGQPKMLWE